MIILYFTVPLILGAPTNGGNEDPGSRTVRFTDDNGYLRIDKGTNCLEACDRPDTWAGHCDHCALSNGSPGFCCHSDGRGHCSDAMLEALGDHEGHHCVIPKSFNNDALIQTRTLSKPDCGAQCGTGKCGVCGPIGYCCNANSSGTCPGSFIASFKEQGHTESKCIIPTSRISNLNKEVAEGFSCTDVRKTTCEKLSTFHAIMPDGVLKALSPVFHDCKKFFSVIECAMPHRSAAETELPVCITTITNYCGENIEPDVTLEAEEEKSLEISIENEIDDSWDVKQKALYRFVRTVSALPPQDIIPILPKINGANGAHIMMTSLASSMTTAGLTDHLEELTKAFSSQSFAVFNLVIMTIDALALEWHEGDGDFHSVDLKVDYNHLNTPFKIRQRDFEQLIANSGASAETQQVVSTWFKQIFTSVVPWTEQKAFIFDSFFEYDFQPWMLSDLMVALASVEKTENYGLVILEVAKNLAGLVLRGDLQDIIISLHSPKGRTVAQNAAWVLTIQNHLLTENIEISSKNLRTAMDRTMGRDPFQMRVSEWDDILAMKFTYIAARLASETTRAGTIALAMRNKFSSINHDVVTDTNRISTLGGTKKVYKELVSFGLAITSMSMPILQMAIEGIPDPSIGTPSQQLAKYFVGFALQYGTHDEYEAVRALTMMHQWARLEAPLLAVALLDNDERVSDAEIDAAFGCSTVCDFSSIDWTFYPPISESVEDPIGPAPPVTTSPQTVRNDDTTTTSTMFPDTTEFTTQTTLGSTLLTTQMTNPPELTESTTTSTMTSTTTMGRRLIIAGLPVDGERHDQTSFNNLLMRTNVQCSACEKLSDAVVDAQQKWMENQRVMDCQHTAWCNNEGCFCPIYRDDDSRVTGSVADSIFASVVIDYLHNATDLSIDELQFVAESLSTLPMYKLRAESHSFYPLTARTAIQNHIVTRMYENGIEGQSWDKISAAIFSDTFSGNLVFIIETILRTRNELVRNDQDPLQINAWDLSVFDWAISGYDKETELSKSYMENILNGLAVFNGTDHPLEDVLCDEYESIWGRAIGLACDKTEFHGSVVWDCPNEETAQNPNEIDCHLVQIIEEVCLVWAESTFKKPLSGVMGGWAVQWFKDQLDAYQPAINGSIQAGLISGFASSISGLSDFDAWDGANQLSGTVSEWFNQYMTEYRDVIDDILENDDQWEGLAWLLAAGGLWGEGFANENGGSQWLMYDMMDEVRNGGLWDMFHKWDDGTYIDATMTWFSDWIRSQDSNWQNEDWLKDWMDTEEAYTTLFNSTHELKYEVEPPILPWFDPLIYPVETECLQSIYEEDIIHYFTYMGMDEYFLNEISKAMSELDSAVLPYGDVLSALTDYFLHYFDCNTCDPDGGCTIMYCPINPISEWLEQETFVALVARLEVILGAATFWDEEIGTAEEFKQLNWDWLTFDKTKLTMTGDFLQTNLENMSELAPILNSIINDIKLVETIQGEIGFRDVTTAVATEPETTTAAVTTTPPTTTIDADAMGGANDGIATTPSANPYAPDKTDSETTTAVVGDASGDANPYAPVQDTDQASTQPAVCSSCSTDVDCGDWNIYWMECKKEKCICSNYWRDANGDPSDGCETYDGKYKKDRNQCDGIMNPYAPVETDASIETTTATTSTVDSGLSGPSVCGPCNNNADCGDWNIYWMECKKDKCICSNYWRDANGDASDGCEKYDGKYKKDRNQCDGYESDGGSNPYAPVETDPVTMKTTTTVTTAPTEAVTTTQTDTTAATEPSTTPAMTTTPTETTTPATSAAPVTTTQADITNADPVLCGACTTDADCDWDNYFMTCGNVGKCICADYFTDLNGDPTDGCEMLDYGSFLNQQQCDSMTTTVATDDQVGGTAELCSSCNEDADCGDYDKLWMSCSWKKMCVCGDYWFDANGDPTDGCEAYEPLYQMDHQQCSKDFSTDDDTVEGVIKGDPHVKIKIPGQEAICFEVSVDDGAIIDLLSSTETGLEVNGQMIQEGKNLRLARVFINTPKNVEISIRKDQITIGRNNIATQVINYEKAENITIDDAHIDVWSLNSGDRKNGAIITLFGENGKETQFRVTTKSDNLKIFKSSMKFEIINTSGVEDTPLTGLIGHSIVPGRYTIDKEGQIHVDGERIDARVEWNHQEYCHHIKSMELVRLFLGNGVNSYSVVSEFSHPIALKEDLAPK